jgi:hypothetical protein
MIAGISVFDALLVVVFADSIMLQEENPVGQSLLRAGNGDVTLFVLTKLIGTAAVFIVLRELEKRDALTATFVTNALLAFQTWLVWYLCISDWQTTLGDMIVVALVMASCFAIPTLRELAKTQPTRQSLLDW